MGDPDGYLTEIEVRLIACPVISDFVIVRAWSNADDGYIRVRANLINGDFLEAAEYFVLQPTGVETVDYRHQWMDGGKTILRRRWDNTPDHPELPSFPHHIHVGDEETVTPGQPMSMLALLRILESEITNR
jgi:hypothetical protein